MNKKIIEKVLEERQEEIARDYPMGYRIVLKDILEKALQLKDEETQKKVEELKKEFWTLEQQGYLINKTIDKIFNQSHPSQRDGSKTDDNNLGSERDSILYSSGSGTNNQNKKEVGE